MSKNFLSKKSWHTGSVKHMERVWKAEQKAEEEQRKMAILKRELQEEQKQLELKKLQEQATGKPVSERLEWMYTIKKGAASDEYLTGKTMPKAEEEKQLEQLRKTPGSLFMKDKSNVVVDAQNKVRDDPLLMIKQQEQRALKEILHNPVKMNKIKDAPDVKKALEKIDKKKKKEVRRREKKEKKEKKKKKEQEEDGSKKGVSRSPSPAKEAKSERKRSRSRSKSPVKHRSKSRSRSPRRSRSRSRSRSPRRHRDRSRSPVRHNRRHERSASRSRSRSPRRSRHETSRNDRSSNGHSQNGNNGNNNSSYQRRDQKKRMSNEEREERLRQMMADGEVHEEQRWKRLKRAEEETKQEQHEESTKDEHASFMMDMNKEVYTHHNDKLEDRMRRNIHLIQRNTGSSLSREES